jgi:hypothetical protein
MCIRTIVLIFGFVIAGCGGGGGGEPVSAPAQPGGGSTTNSPPTIQGQPATSVAAGQLYIFEPVASDPDGDRLSFSVTNLPPGATFNSTTGRLSWTPTSVQVGTYRNVTISVSDGRSAVSLPAFSITVSDWAPGSATVSWVAPTENTDGSPLTDLAGYEIRYGRNPNALDYQVRIDTPGLTIYTIENLSPGTWYFAVLARNRQGIVSSPSAVASKTIS